MRLSIAPIVGFADQVPAGDSADEEEDEEVGDKFWFVETVELSSQAMKEEYKVDAADHHEDHHDDLSPQVVVAPQAIVKNAKAPCGDGAAGDDDSVIELEFGVGRYEEDDL